MQEFKLESVDRMKEATRRILRVLESRSNMISNNKYDIEEDNIFITRVNELLLECCEDCEKLPAEVDQLTKEIFEENLQIYEAGSQAINDKYNELIDGRNELLDKCNELLEINNELHEKIVSASKANKRLSFLCGSLVGVIISLIITIIILLQ
jgi:hypothetical protein